MKRSRQFAKNTAMGYAQVLANIGFTILSVPLALHYLGKEEFGLWALSQQIGGYFLLIDLGLSSAMSRLLANHKDNLNGGPYGALLLTGGLVFVVQGALLAVLGSLFALIAPPLFNIPESLAHDFRNVLVILSVLSGATIALRAVTSPLWAFQRLDISYGFGIVSLVGGLGCLWLGFKAGWGIYSFAWASLPPMVVCTAWGLIFCLRNNFYPSCGCWTKPSWRAFKEMFVFGKDVMLMAIGSQLVNASQIMILGRVAGLEAAATYSIGTKFYSLGTQLTGRLFESSAPALTEMFVRKESGRLRERFADIFRASLFIATSGAVALVVANATVVRWWTSGVIEWSLRWDLMLGALLLATTCSRCLVGLFGIAGNLLPVRNLYLAEAAVFIAIGIPAAAHFGIMGLMGASLLVHLLVTVAFSAVAAQRLLTSTAPLKAPAFTAAGIFAAAGLTATLFPSIDSWAVSTFAIAIILVFSALSFFSIISSEARHRLLAQSRGVFGSRTQ